MAARGTNKKSAKSATKAKTKSAAKKTAAKKATKSAAKKATKPAAKKTAAKTTTKSAAKKTAAKTKSAAKKSTRAVASKGKSAASSKSVATPVLPGLLGDWVHRVHQAAEVLESTPGVSVLARWQGPPAAPEVLDAIEAKLGFSLGEAARNLYLQADGLVLVWAPTDEGPKPVRGRPRMEWLEHLSTGGAIALSPVAEVFGLRRRPTFDYVRYTEDDVSRWGFDFPGNYYTPAFIRVGDELRVQVGDDHGAAWDGPKVTLDRYLENVLASWGSIDARGKQFVRGRGKAIAAVSLASLLPSRKERDANELRRALDGLLYDRKRRIPEDKWHPVVTAALRASDDLVVSRALQLITRLGPAAEVVRDDLLAYARRAKNIWDVAEALAALPPAPLGRDFLRLLAVAAEKDHAHKPLARVLAASLDADPDPRHVDAWLAALTGPAPTPFLMVSFVESPALREAAEAPLAERIAALPDEPDVNLSGDHFAALAWADLHRDDRRPSIVARLRDLLDDSGVGDWFDLIADCDSLGACLDAALRAVAGSNEILELLPARARRLAKHGPAIVAAFNAILDDEEFDNRRILDNLIRLVAPHLPLDRATLARVAALLS